MEIWFFKVTLWIIEEVLAYWSYTRWRQKTLFFRCRPSFRFRFSFHIFLSSLVWYDKLGFGCRTVRVYYKRDTELIDASEYNVSKSIWHWWTTEVESRNQSSNYDFTSLNALSLITVKRSFSPTSHALNSVVASTSRPLCFGLECSSSPQCTLDCLTSTQDLKDLMFSFSVSFSSFYFRPSIRVCTYQT